MQPAQEHEARSPHRMFKTSSFRATVMFLHDTLSTIGPKHMNMTLPPSRRTRMTSASASCRLR
eukprot:3462830-Amphidinium_carterae.1